MKHSSALIAALGMGLSGQHTMMLQPGNHRSWGNPYVPTTDFKSKTFPKGKAHRVGVAAQKRAAKKRRNIRAKSSKR